jgi:hypothetical protein
MWIGFQWYIATDTAGNVYFSSLNCVFKLDMSGVVTRIAGTSRPGFSGDGGPATSAQLHNPAGLAIDSAGNLFIVDSGNDRIRRVSPDGVITTVAGNGTIGFSGDGGPATSAQLGLGVGPPNYEGLYLSLYLPRYVAVDGLGNLFIADYGRIRKVSADGIINTLVEKVSGPLTVDGAGNLFVANTTFDPGNRNMVVKIARDGALTTAAGGGEVSGNTLGFTGLTSSACVDDLSGDGGLATQTGLCSLTGIAVDRTGNLFVGENWLDDPVGQAGEWVLRKVSPDGIITTAVGNTRDWAEDGGLATAGMIGFGGGVAVDSAGNVLITDNESIRKISLDGIINTAAGQVCCHGDAVWEGKQHFSGDGGPATSAIMSSPASVAVDWTGNLFIADQGGVRVRKVTPDGIISTVVGGGTLSGSSADGGPATNASLSFNHNGPPSLAVDGAGNLFFVDGNRVRRVSPDGIITTVAGGGTMEAASADGGPATNAHFGVLGGIVTDGVGNLLIAEPNAHRVRKVTPSGIITTFAGTGTLGNWGDGRLAVHAQLAYPFGLGVDDAGDVFIAVGFGEQVRLVTPDGVITTVAGNGKLGYSGDGGPATDASLTMKAIAADGLGNLFIAGGVGVREVTRDGIITTVAGNGQFGDSGDGGPATEARFGYPSSIAVNRTGNVYVADPSNNVVRVLSPVIGPSN